MDLSEEQCKSLRSRRDLLFRKTQGKIQRDDYYKKIQSFTNKEVDPTRFLSLEETDELENQIFWQKLLWVKKKYDCTYKEVVDFIRLKIHKKPFYLLIDDGWKYCGAYRVINEISEEYDFDKLVSDEIEIIPYDLSFKIRIDYDFNEIECAHTIYHE